MIINICFQLLTNEHISCLKILGNTSEFQRISLLLEETLEFDMDINVSVFETNIRGDKLLCDLKIFIL